MASAYNPEEPVDEKDNSLCAAHGCPLPGSVKISGQDWCCCYHAKLDSSLWQIATIQINYHIRLQQILAAAKAITNAEFDAIQASNRWALNELIIPVKGESHAHWVHRITQTVHKSLKSKIYDAIKRAVPASAPNGTSKKQTVSWAVNELTSGALLKTSTGRTKPQGATV